jgi:peroxiredoxin
MSQQSGAVSVSSRAKKGVILIILLVAVGSLILFLLSKGGSKGVKIIGVGDQAPNFTLTSLDGKQVTLSDLRGKVVMVHFWATWCPPCVEEMPTLQTLNQRFLGKDFELLAVSVDEDGAAGVGSFMQRNRLNVPVLLDPAHATAASYGTFKFPETYILDRSGIVKYKIIGSRDWSDPAAIKALQDMLTQE